MLLPGLILAAALFGVAGVILSTLRRRLSLGRISDLRVYPVKACQGISLKTAELGQAGFRLDRVFSILDLHGIRHTERQALSQRKLPKLATLKITMDEANDTLTIEAPAAAGLPPLTVPLEEENYRDADDVTVVCSGESTTSAGSWSLGSMKSKLVGRGSADWLTSYLNTVAPTTLAKRNPARYVLVRSMAGGQRDMTKYAGPTQRDDSPFQMQKLPVIKGDRVRYHDFAPFLLVARESIKDLSAKMNTTAAAAASAAASGPAAAASAAGRAYPLEPFRPNIVVDRTRRAWEEEEWQDFDVGRTAFRRLKVCARCTVPARDQQTGEFINQGNKLLVQKTLRKMFPDKCEDEEWGVDWQGPTFGIHVGHGGIAGGRLAIGDDVTVAPEWSWSFARAYFRAYAPLHGGLVAATFAAVAAAAFSLDASSKHVYM